MAKYTLHYFPLKGRGELIRFLFAAHGEDYKDNRIEFKDWPSHKESMYSHAMPVLEINGSTHLSQSMSICRYLAREFGMDGKTSEEKARVDEIVECFQDIMNDMIKVKFSPEAAKEAAEKNYEKTCSRILPFLEKLLKSNGDGNGFFVGDSMTIADLQAFVSLESPLGIKPDLLKECPKIAALRKRVEESPKIAEYLKKRPETDF
uniref:Glutathione S-transferase 2 n=1 Tax=Idiosepius paradoxus TaxID=294707 RepID=A0A0H5ANU2_IDIPA|nr:glutathione S-transferase 2 [Idiosepius paradoxus]